MTIQWLNPEKTRAIVTRGWIWKRWAEVYLNLVSRWCFSATDERVDVYLACDIWDARNGKRRPDPEPPKPRCRRSPWQPVSSLPPARLIERGEP